MNAKLSPKELGKISDLLSFLITAFLQPPKMTLLCLNNCLTAFRYLLYPDKSEQQKQKRT